MKKRYTIKRNIKTMHFMKIGKSTNLYLHIDVCLCAAVFVVFQSTVQYFK